MQVSSRKPKEQALQTGRQVVSPSDGTATTRALGITLAVMHDCGECPSLRVVDELFIHHCPWAILTHQSRVLMVSVTVLSCRGSPGPAQTCKRCQQRNDL